VKDILSTKYPVIDIDGVRAIYPTGWALVRASNTQGALVLRFEADTEEDLAAIRKEVEQILESVIAKLEDS
jgi:phosphomannomutase/phosphoglucomutase